METEQSSKVSNEQLLLDIKLTIQELEAYQKIGAGMIVLARLPENVENGGSVMYNFEYQKYSLLEKECADFLKKLYALKEERGLG